MQLTASALAGFAGGSLIGPDVVVDGASFDSRSVRPGQLFVPIVAERDGHDFIAGAVAAGATAYLTERGAADVEATAIVVADTAAALVDIATAARNTLDVPVVGVTGSVGKTSTKDLIAAAVGAARRTVASARSFNNEMGLPVTILGAAADTEVVVVEMGMRGFGEIARLCAIARPTVGLVTRVGAAHSARLGGIDGVAAAKAELVAALGRDGTAVLNADDERVRAMAALTQAAVVTFGESPGADVRVVGTELDRFARPRFRLVTPWGSASVALRVSGRHMALNAAAAIAVAGAVGVGLDLAVPALEQASIVDGRMTVHELASGAVVVDDAYNANPTSVAAALEALAAITADRRIAVLGPMAEVDDAESAHRQIAAHAERLAIEVVAVGTDLYGIAPVDDPVAAVGTLGAGAAVLVKGSLVAGLQAVAARLVAGA